jgi:hypothetical protein
MSRMKTFKEAEIRDLLKRVQNEEISFSRMVELVNHKAAEKMLIEINNVFETYTIKKSKEGGYCKILRNKKKWLELFLWKGDERLKAAWNIVADSPLHGWTLKAKEEREKLGLS